MGKRYKKGCLAPLIIKEMQMQAKMRYHVLPVRMVLIRKTRDKCQWGCGDKGRRFFLSKVEKALDELHLEISVSGMMTYQTIANIFRKRNISAISVSK